MNPAAHPRSRGENAYQACVGRAFAGSSPLTRGKQATHHGLQDHLGLIPAHAGKTSRGGRRRGRGPAHPRSRGENPSPRLTTCATVGSSPLTRGKQRQGKHADESGRLIPAHAGKTTGWRSRRCGCRAHPRSRGENLISDVSHGGVSGSSPLTRGKHSESLRDALVNRLIPAHAGKTRAGGRPGVRRPAPLTRGKQLESFLAITHVRLIPAHAGKTHAMARSRRDRPAHPRSRGENALLGTPTPVALGSSPLTRGKPRAPVGQALTARLIPAHAGKTLRT